METSPQHLSFSPHLDGDGWWGGEGQQTSCPLCYLQAAVPAARQSVRNVPRIACAKVERGPKQRRRNAAAANEDVPLRVKRVYIVSGGPMPPSLW